MYNFLYEIFMSIIREPILIVFIIFGIVIDLFGKNILGWFGEHWTKKSLKVLPKDEYFIINDVFFKSGGITHQIDHIIISKYGIFSIETKQYNGFITGDKYDKYWIRHVGKKKYYYTNPIKQNYGHVKSLSELLNLNEDKIFNIVCIPSRAKLEINHDGELVRHDTIVNKILSYKDVIIDNVNEIIEKVNKNNIHDKKIKKEHNKYIKENIIDNNINKCPICGEKLIERSGKYGKFIGCSNYPKCRYIRK